MTGNARHFIWDAHSNVPLEPGRPIEDVLRHKRLGFGFVSLNVGYDPAHIDDMLAALAWYRKEFARHPDFSLVETLADLDTAIANDQLAVAFDLEGALCLFERPEMVHLWARLGIRQMHLAYNRNNSVAGGCYDPELALTPLGVQVVAELNRSGIVIDCSHGGKRCTLDIMDASDKPVVFSHSNVRALVDVERNVDDEQIRACAATGGVIGIAGYSRFLGNTPSGVQDLVRHIDYIAQLVGVEHVGIGWDYIYPEQEGSRLRDPDKFEWWFPDAAINAKLGITGDDKFTPLECVQEIPAALAALGYDGNAIAKVMGGNFRRVAEACWPKLSPRSRSF